MERTTGNWVADGMYELDKHFAESEQVFEDCQVCGDAFLPESLSPFNGDKKVCTGCIEFIKNEEKTMINNKINRLLNQEPC